MLQLLIFCTLRVFYVLFTRQRSWLHFPMFFLKNFIVLFFTFRSASYLELVIVYNGQGWGWYFSIWISNWPLPFIENNFHFPCTAVTRAVLYAFVFAGCFPGMSLHLSYLRNPWSYYRTKHPAIWSFPGPLPPLGIPNTVTTSGCQGERVPSVHPTLTLLRTTSTWW